MINACLHMERFHELRISPIPHATITLQSRPLLYNYYLGLCSTVFGRCALNGSLPFDKYDY